MSSTQAQQVSNIITTLNGIAVGELGSITTKLQAVGSELAEFQQAELADLASQARMAIEEGNVKDFRRLVAQLVSRLGHLRDQSV